MWKTHKGHSRKFWHTFMVAFPHLRQFVGGSLHHHHFVDHVFILGIVRLAFPMLGNKCVQECCRFVLEFWTSTTLENMTSSPFKIDSQTSSQLIAWVIKKTDHENPKMASSAAITGSLGTQGLSRNGSWPKSETPCPNPVPWTNFTGLRVAWRDVAHHLYMSVWLHIK